MREKIKEAIKEVLDELNIGNIQFSVNHPSDMNNGDYSSNVCIVSAKKLSKTSEEVGKIIKVKMFEKLDNIERIEIIKGFLNFYLSKEFFSNYLQYVMDNSDNFGKNDENNKNNVVIEYTSPNLFKPLHIGNLVGNIIGESLSRMYELSGFNVKRVNYPSDVGLTVAKAVWGLLKIKKEPDNIETLGEAYTIGNVQYEESKDEIEKINLQIYNREDKNIINLWKKGVQTSLDSVLSLCERLGTKFDLIIFESETEKIGKKIVMDNIGNVFEKDEGAVIYRGEKEGLHTRVFINSKGIPTYEAKDIGNFYIKQKKYPNWDTSIIITGNEQKEYFRVLKSVIEKIFDIKDKNVNHISTGLLILSTGKMSSRKGNVITAESILNDITEEVKKIGNYDDSEKMLANSIAVSALKYQILKQTTGSDIHFKKERALSVEGETGPYLQYTYARVSSLLNKMEDINITFDNNNEIYLPERIMYQFNEALNKSLEKNSPHIFVKYLTDMCSLFNTWYGKEKILDGNNLEYKKALLKSINVVLGKSLWVLGIEVTKRV